MSLYYNSRICFSPINALLIAQGDASENRHRVSKYKAYSEQAF